MNAPRDKHTVRALLLVTAVVTGAAGWVLLGGARPTSTGRPEIPSTRHEPNARAAGRSAEVVALADSEASAEPFAPSLRDTAVDGAITTDELGNLVVSPELFHRFSYFLSTEGERAPEEIRRAVASSAPELGASAHARFLALYDDFVNYRHLAAERIADLAPGAYREAFEATVAVQSEVFGEETAARLFATDRVLTDIALTRRELHADGGSAAEIEEATRELEAELPDELVAGRRERRGFSLARALVADARAAGASAQAIDAIRAEHLGQDAARRLRALDDSRGVVD